MDNKQVVTFMYKCRQCGQVYGTGCTGESNAYMTMVQLSGEFEVDDYMIGEPPKLLGLHTCTAPYHGQGLSDLIGYRKGEH